MSRLAQELRRACSELGLRADFEFALTLPDGQQIQTVARIVDLGAPKGMLVVQSDECVWENSNLLTSAGYGYSVLGEPGSTERFDLESYQEMFAGWSGAPDKKPHWME